MILDVDDLRADESGHAQARLAVLETAVWNRVNDLRMRSRMRQARALVVVAALGVGGTNGMLMLADRAELSELKVFSLSTNLGSLSGLDAQE